jgi:bacterial/archaeal transporter family protein
MEWLILVLISAVFLASRTILTKKILLKNDTLPLLFFVSLISTVVMIFFYKSISLDLTLVVYSLILLKSLVIAVAWFCIYQAYKNLDISTVSPLRNLSPIFLIVLSLIFLGEKASLINYVRIFILIISAYMLETKSFSNLLEPFKFFKTKYFLLIIISMIGNSISAILDKIILKSMNHHSLMFLFYLFLTIIYFIFIASRKNIKSLKLFSGVKNIILILAISASALLADFSYFMAVTIPGTLIILIIPLRRISTFISTLLGGRLFHEKNLLHKSIICLVMVFAVFLITL